LPKRIEFRNFRTTSTGGGKALAAQLLCQRQLPNYPTPPPSKKMPLSSNTYSDCAKGLVLKNCKVTSTGGDDLAISKFNMNPYVDHQ